MSQYEHDYDMSSVAVYDESAEDSIREQVDVEKLLEADIGKDDWDDVRKLVVLQVKMGLTEATKNGMYADSVVKTALALLKQAEKPFDENSASEIKDAFAQFRLANKAELRKHKDIASNVKN